MAPATQAPLDETRSVRVLVVEEFGPARSLLTRVLVAEGFEVLTAAGAERAVALCEGERVDVLVTELSAVGGAGIDIARHALARNPHVDVLFMSGCPDAQRVADRAGIRCQVLPKPIDIDDLTRLVRRSRPTGT